MKLRFVLAFALLLVGCAPPATSVDQATAAARLEAALDNASEVRFYFTSVTDEPKFTARELMDFASIKIVRGCGANCANYMRDVIEHFKTSRPVDCPMRGQNTVILVRGVPPLLYSDDGHIVDFMGQCYFNRASVDDIVRRGRFIGFWRE